MFHRLTRGVELTDAGRGFLDDARTILEHVEQAKAKPAAIQWFVGQVMKASGGKVDPKAVNVLLKTKLGI